MYWVHIWYVNVCVCGGMYTCVCGDSLATINGALTLTYPSGEASIDTSSKGSVENKQKYLQHHV